MIPDEAYMQRCLQLAALGLGKVQPNPMVGAVIVHNNSIIGEGFHQQYGQSHAEVNAIQSVNDKSKLAESTIYVSLEPCSHYGKTPPCADLLIQWKIPRVVVGTTDPHQKVNGQGISKLKNAGVQVKVGVLEDECRFLNRRFFAYHQKKRPYIILKWAQSSDGFMDIDRANGHREYWITNKEMRILSHKWRSEEQAILVGYNTYCNDHPQLTTREYPGNNPQRYIMVNKGIPYSISKDYNILPNQLDEVIDTLYHHQIQSVIIEGGRKTLDLFLQADLWDEARVFIGNQKLGQGGQAPAIPALPDKETAINHNLLRYYYHV
ncbi:MAG: bifunctional diaminohydroxyphosphoribosylaminopyrimidine deaminase/5-amino-6-(5-phosphoribosylamino)uracil reductase RibD [Bacteroidales bacterium]|nr:bifunctional diaminohydroxyphosphoribosylaminopyrimidine deaminase/5-amino-6-(5-phosphoribosylamino)uracil reductase RibD [Bacteroidales bacterium]